MSDFQNHFPLRERPADLGPQALDGVRVIDFTRLLAGPYATQILADFGADVIKVELPGRGDDARAVMLDKGIAGESAMHLALNRNKRSICIDLTSAEGRAVVLDLIASADIVVENFTSKVMRKFGLDYASLKDRFPRLIYCSVSGYGRTGKFAEAAALDSTPTAECGAGWLNARPDERPVMNAVPMTDTTTAMNAALAMLLALQARNAHGRGQWVEAAMYDSALANQTFRAYETLATGENPALTPLHSEEGVPRGQFDTVDGQVWITAGSDKMFRAFATAVVDRPDWLESEAYGTPAGRTRNARALIGEIAAILAAQPSDAWAERCKAVGVPCGALRTPREALLSDITQDREMVYRIDHPTAGTIPVIAQPIRLHDTPAPAAKAPPLLGADGRAILTEVLGYDPTRIAALAEQGAIELHE